MRIVIAAIGRGRKEAPETTLTNEYAQRIAGLGASIGIGPMEVRELEDRPAGRKQREGELLLAQISNGALSVALDGTGRSFTSEAFAKWLSVRRDEGCREIVFLIGGADGLAENVRQQANLQLSLGAMTWPHMLARAMLSEQIYRAVTILANHPYHRG